MGGSRLKAEQSFGNLKACVPHTRNQNQEAEFPNVPIRYTATLKSSTRIKTDNSAHQSGLKDTEPCISLGESLLFKIDATIRSLLLAYIVYSSIASIPGLSSYIVKEKGRILDNPEPLLSKNITNTQGALFATVEKFREGDMYPSSSIPFEVDNVLFLMAITFQMFKSIAAGAVNKKLKETLITDLSAPDLEQGLPHLQRPDERITIHRDINEIFNQFKEAQIGKIKIWPYFLFSSARNLSIFALSVALYNSPDHNPNAKGAVLIHEAFFRLANICVLDQLLYSTFFTNSKAGVNDWDKFLAFYEAIYTKMFGNALKIN